MNFGFPKIFAQFSNGLRIVRIIPAYKLAFLLGCTMLVSCGGGGGSGSDAEPTPPNDTVTGAGDDNTEDDTNTDGIADTTPPVITILGDNPATTPRGAVYVDEGATALDAVDGVVAVVITDTVDASTVGSYTVTYAANDMANNSATVTRTVDVIAVDTNAEVIRTGGAFEVTLIPGPIDVDGDGTADIEFVSFGVNSGFLDASAPFGLVGNIGGSPGTGAAWARGSSDTSAEDGVGRNEIIAEFRGALLNSDDNWSKVNFSSGDGWVQWAFGATSDIVEPVVFVREGADLNLTVAEAVSIAYPSVVVSSGGAIGATLAPGLVDVDGDGTADINFVSFGVDSGFLDASTPFGLVGNIGGPPGSGLAWVRDSSFAAATDGIGRNEIIAEFRGAQLNSEDNWSKVHFSSGDGWVKWSVGITSDIVSPVVFVREGLNLDLTAAEARALTLEPVVMISGGALGTTMAPGLVDVDGDGLSDVNFVSFGVDSGFLDATGGLGLVGNIGGPPGTGLAWVRESSDALAEDGAGRNEIIAEFRGAELNSSDNWSKVQFSSGDGWAQWSLGVTSDVVMPLTFVREGAEMDLTAAEAAALANDAR